MFRRRIRFLAQRSLVIIMADEQLDQLNFFRAFIKEAEEGATIPPVAEDDLKRLYEASLDMTRRYCGKDGVLSMEVMTRACSPGANLPAAWLRHTQLRMLVRHGLLAQWQHDTALDDAVFHVAATIPMSGVRFDPETFVQRLSHCKTA
jgi:hypothetical protein